VAALAFFLLGLPLALIANRVVVQLTDFEEPPDGDDGEAGSSRQLPWHRGLWPQRVRWSVLALLPACMAIAATRFDLVQAAIVSVLIAALLVCTATDLLRFRVPNVITYPAIILALVASVVMPDADLAGAIGAALLIGSLFFVMAVVTGGGMGIGDAKLVTLIGAMLGLPAAGQALVIGVLSAGLVILPFFLLGRMGRRDPLPYAPFLALAAVAVGLAQGTAFAPL
jgi:prepilin signal peptidase PulO-like enzyme (type II secretory pathway)